jgi:hypothetical protein
MIWTGTFVSFDLWTRRVRPYASRSSNKRCPCTVSLNGRMRSTEGRTFPLSLHPPGTAYRREAGPTSRAKGWRSSVTWKMQSGTSKHSSLAPGRNCLTRADRETEERVQRYVLSEARVRHLIFFPVGLRSVRGPKKISGYDFDCQTMLPSHGKSPGRGSGDSPPPFANGKNWRHVPAGQDLVQSCKQRAHIPDIRVTC